VQHVGFLLAAASAWAAITLVSALYNMGAILGPFIGGQVYGTQAADGIHYQSPYRLSLVSNFLSLPH
jgi:fucose permease